MANIHSAKWRNKFYHGTKCHKIGTPSVWILTGAWNKCTIDKYMIYTSEIAPDVFRISVFVPEINLQFNHFTVISGLRIYPTVGMQA